MEKNPMEKCLTNEVLLKKKQFKSQFDLVNYAIKLAGDMVRSGRPAYFDSGESPNPALEVLGEIAVGRDRLDRIDFSGRENVPIDLLEIDDEDDEDDFEEEVVVKEKKSKHK